MVKLWVACTKIINFSSLFTVDWYLRNKEKIPAGCDWLFFVTWHAFRKSWIISISEHSWRAWKTDAWGHLLATMASLLHLSASAVCLHWQKWIWAHKRCSMWTAPKMDDQTQIQTQTFSVWKRPEAPHSINEATSIQTTVIDNQQQFLYIHSTVVTALCVLSSPFNRKSSRKLTDSSATYWSVSTHSYGWLFLVGLTLHYIFHSSMHRTHW